MRLVPEVPIVRRPARRHADALGELIEVDLVLPLLVVDLRRHAAAAVQRNPQAVPAHRFFAKNLLLKPKRLVAQSDRPLARLGATFFLETRAQVRPQKITHLFSLDRSEGSRRSIAPRIRRHRKPGLHIEDRRGDDRKVLPHEIEGAGFLENRFTSDPAARESQRVRAPRLDGKNRHVVAIRAPRLRAWPWRSPCHCRRSIRHPPRCGHRRPRRNSTAHAPPPWRVQPVSRSDPSRSPRQPNESPDSTPSGTHRHPSATMWQRSRARASSRPPWRHLQRTIRDPAHGRHIRPRP